MAKYEIKDGVAIFPEGIIEIEENAFGGCKELKSVIIPNSVTEIGRNAFLGCTRLTSVNIPNSVTEIGLNAFLGCKSLTSVNFPNSVTEIGSNTFPRCIGLTSVTIPDSVTKIGSYAFEGCKSLTSVTIPNSVTSIGDYAFDGCSGLTEVTIGNSVTSIGSCAFRDCSGLTSITIPNSVTKIGENAFSGCTSLTEVNYNAGNCKSMGMSTYPFLKDCLSLKMLNIGNNVKIIPSYAYADCIGLTTIIIPDTVTEIGESAFEGCNRLTQVTSLNPIPPICEENIFERSIYSKATLFVPKDSFAKYFIDEEWGKFSIIKKIERLVSSIKIDKTDVELIKGDTAIISAMVTPTDVTITDIIWESSNPEIATVDQTGKVVALKRGNVTITAKAIDGSDITASCNITVVDAKITLSQEDMTLPVNEVMTLSCEVVPSTTKVEWSTSNAEVAPIKKKADGSIFVVGLSEGKAIITAKTTDGTDASASCDVTICAEN